MMADTMNRGLGNTGQQPRHSNQGGGRQEESSSGLAGSVMEGAQNVASTVGHAAEQAWDTTRQYAQQAGSAVADAAETAWDSSRDFMRRYPFATLAIGFGLGFLVCLAVSNRS
jgi:ElaB/YqjD/DUF883 family membrane-anchored ribosome-binding protein